MNPDPDENQFQALFGELKQHDGQLAPSFERHLAGAHRLHVKASVGAGVLNYRIRIAAAVTLVMAALSVGIVVHHLNRSNPIAVKMAPQDRSSSKGHSDQPPVSLANWESPTDFLLQPPDDWARSTN